MHCTEQAELDTLCVLTPTYLLYATDEAVVCSTCTHRAIPKAW